MPLRDEFQLLDEKCTKLRRGQDLSQNFLKEVRTHIELCEHIAKTDEERSVIGRTAYWWRKRATNFGLGMPEPDSVPAQAGSRKLLPAGPPKYELSTNDKRFLRSLRIAPNGDKKDEDGGA